MTASREIWRNNGHDSVRLDAIGQPPHPSTVDVQTTSAHISRHGASPLLLRRQISLHLELLSAGFNLLEIRFASAQRYLRDMRHAKSVLSALTQTQVSRCHLSTLLCALLLLLPCNKALASPGDRLNAFGSTSNQIRLSSWTSHVTEQKLTGEQVAPEGKVHLDGVVFGASMAKVVHLSLASEMHATFKLLRTNLSHLILSLHMNHISCLRVSRPLGQSLVCPPQISDLFAVLCHDAKWLPLPAAEFGEQV